MSAALALLSALLYGVGDFLGGHATRRSTALAVTFASQAVGLLGLAVLVPALSRAAPPAVDLAWGAGAGVAGAAGVLLLYHGLATGLASVVAPITGVCAIAIPVVFGAVALGERAGPLAIAGIVLAMIAVVLLGQGGTAGAAEWEEAVPIDSARTAAAPRAQGFQRSVPIALLSGLAIGVFLVCLGRTASASGMWPLLAARVVSVGLLAVAILWARTGWLPAPSARRVTMNAGAFDVAANGVYVLAVREGTLGLTATLASLYPASTVALAALVWRERLRPVQVAGLVLAFAATVLITWR